MEKHIILALSFLVIILLTHNMTGIFSIIMFASYFGLGWTLGDILGDILKFIIKRR
jgi:hypothetical protein